jgi:hypothetical protein
MSVDRVQEGISKEAVRASRTRVDVAGRVEWAAVATGDVTRRVAFVGVVEELFGAEFER